MDMNLQVPKISGIFSVAERLLASEEGLTDM
jgi:hypothetical protein